MKKYILFLLISTLSIAQNLCHNDILNGEKISANNKTDFFKNFDFSNLWMSTANENILGVIGNDFQKISIQFLCVVKNENNYNEYLVYGKSEVKGNICDFIGKITIENIAETNRIWFGADNELKKLQTKTQGLINAKYEFYENKTHKYSGCFTGKLKTKWYLDNNNIIKYDNINAHSDGYFNNSFVGIWKMYNSLTEKICNWGDYRVPNVSCEFDIGASEFSVSEKYKNNGWNK